MWTPSKDNYSYGKEVKLNLYYLYSFYYAETIQQMLTSNNDPKNTAEVCKVNGKRKHQWGIEVVSK